ncbi:hypothetical protein ACTWQJ_07080 [Streptomyces sp. KR55]
MSVAAALEVGSGTGRASRLALGGAGTSRGAADAERVLLGGPATESVFREADVAVPTALVAMAGSVVRVSRRRPASEGEPGTTL